MPQNYIFKDYDNSPRLINSYTMPTILPKIANNISNIIAATELRGKFPKHIIAHIIHGNRIKSRWRKFLDFIDLGDDDDCG